MHHGWRAVSVYNKNEGSREYRVVYQERMSGAADAWTTTKKDELIHYLQWLEAGEIEWHDFSRKEREKLEGKINGRTDRK